MRNHPPSSLQPWAFFCRCVADPIALLHYTSVKAGFKKIPLCVVNAPGGTYKNLKAIWQSRVFRRMISVIVRSPFRKKILHLVTVNLPIPDGGVVFTMCHTPWSRVLAQWCASNDF